MYLVLLEIAIIYCESNSNIKLDLLKLFFNIVQQRTIFLLQKVRIDLHNPYLHK